MAFKYYSTFSGLAVVKLFLKILILKNYFLELLKFKEITRERKIQKLMKSHELLASGKSAIGEEISKNSTTFLDQIIWSNIMSLHFCKKEAIINTVKDLIMLEVQSQENLPKKLHIFIATISQIIIFIAEIDFEKENIYSSPECQTWKGTMVVFHLVISNISYLWAGYGNN